MKKLISFIILFSFIFTTTGQDYLFALRPPNEENFLEDNLVEVSEYFILKQKIEKYKKQINEYVRGKMFKKAVNAFYEMYKLDQTGAIIGNCDDKEISNSDIVVSKFFDQKLSFKEKLIKCATILVEVLLKNIFLLSEFERDRCRISIANKLNTNRLSEYKLFLQKFATHLKIEFLVYYQPYPYSDKEPSKRFIPCVKPFYDNMGFLKKIEMFIPPHNGPSDEFHELSHVYQFLILYIMHQLGLITSERSIPYFPKKMGKGRPSLEMPIIWFIDSQINFPVSKEKFDNFLECLILDAIGVEIKQEFNLAEIVGNLEREKVNEGTFIQGLKPVLKQNKSVIVSGKAI